MQYQNAPKNDKDRRYCIACHRKHYASNLMIITLWGKIFIICKPCLDIWGNHMLKSYAQTLSSFKDNFR